MSTDGAWTARQATLADREELRRMLARAERVMLRFGAEHLDAYLARKPFLVAEKAGRIRGFLAFLMFWSPQARLAAAGLADGESLSSWLDLLLPRCATDLRLRGATSLSYVGSATWLIRPLMERGFRLIDHVVAYEKSGPSMPRAGNPDVVVRPVKAADFPALAALDVLAFHPLWRNSEERLRQWRDTLPYFVVATVGESPVGYCYCSTGRPGHGHLVRMAVHPTWHRRGIGTRLVAEAVRFFGQAGVRQITLNTQEKNEPAQALYRGLGFRFIEREATGLWRDLG